MSLTLLFGVATAAAGVLSLANAKRRDGWAPAAAGSVLVLSWVIQLIGKMVLPSEVRPDLYIAVDVVACFVLAVVVFPAFGGRLAVVLASLFTAQSLGHVFYQCGAIPWPLYIRGLNLIYGAMLLATIWDNRLGLWVLYRFCIRRLPGVHLGAKPRPVSRAPADAPRAVRGLRL